MPRGNDNNRHLVLGCTNTINQMLCCLLVALSINYRPVTGYSTKNILGTVLLKTLRIDFFVHGMHQK